MIQLAVIVGLLVVIIVHELGHLLAARATGIRATVFSVGFGPELWSTTWKGLRWRIGLLPLGGYVRIPAIIPPDVETDRRQIGELCSIDLSALGDPQEDVLTEAEAREVRSGMNPHPDLIDADRRTQLLRIETSDELYTFMADAPAGLDSKGLERWGQIRDEHAPDTYHRASWARRTTVILAGSAVNIIGGALLLWVALLVHSPLYHTTWKVVSVAGSTPKSLVGQRAAQLNSEGLTYSDSRRVRDVSAFAKLHPGQAVLVLSSGKLLAINEGGATIARTDASLAGYRRDVGVGEAARGSLKTVHLIVSNTWSVATRAFTDKKIRRETGTVVGAVHAAPQAADFLPQYLLMLSIAIGLVNLLPILPLDGGHFVMSCLRALRVPIARPAWYAYGALGLSFVLALFALGLSNDIRAF